MTITREDFHNVPNTTTVNTTNAPNISSVTLAGTTPGTAKGDSVNKIHSVNSLKIVGAAAASDVAYVTITGTDATGSMHMYLEFFGSVPSAAIQLMAMRAISSGPNVCIFGIGATNKFNVQNAAGATLKNWTTTIVANQLYRIEMSCTPGTTTTNGTINAAYYKDELTSLPAGETSQYASGATVNAGTANIGAYRFGKPNSAGVMTVNISDVAVNPGTLSEIGLMSPGATYTQSVEPYDLVTMPAGTWTQTSGSPTVTIASNTFVAPATPSGTVLVFTSTFDTLTVTVAAHTIFRKVVSGLEGVQIIRL